MTAPLTPHGNSPSEPGPGSGPDLPQHTGDEAADTAPGLSEETRTELRQGAVILAFVTLCGVLLGLLWLWLAPRVPLISDGKAVYLSNTEGEQAVGADGWFGLLGLVFGAVAAAVVFLCYRKGGIAIVAGLAAGSLLASLIGWRLGVWLGPTADVAGHARAVGQGVVFDAPIKLAAKGMLLAWPLAAMAVHLGLTALFGPRDPEPEAGPELHWSRPGTPPAQDAEEQN
ncbi:hypothetical protein J1792_28655 [Streptomyces triculaminicus]|uniref:ABC transporter permease n=2 Tax=Streptomyces TaxID=1883 RepID=A0A939FTR9_9ACTN|nr:hypothetical protein [Streptomyces triculaminicus]QSY47977.1 hypothetical protein J3S04_22430 [Streptomyces griseocarneus]